MSTMKEKLDGIRNCNDYSMIWNTFVGTDSGAKWIFWDEKACARAHMSDPHSLSFRYCLEDFGRTTSNRMNVKKPFGYWNRRTELDQFKHDMMQCCIWQDLGNYRFYHTDYAEWVGVDIDTPEKIAKIEKLRLKKWINELGLNPDEYTIEPLRVRKVRAGRM